LAGTIPTVRGSGCATRLRLTLFPVCTPPSVVGEDQACGLASSTEVVSIFEYTAQVSRATMIPLFPFQLKPGSVAFYCMIEWLPVIITQRRFGSQREEYSCWQVPACSSTGCIHKEFVVRLGLNTWGRENEADAMPNLA